MKTAYRIATMLLSVAILAAACGDGAGDDTTTTVAGETTTTAAPIAGDTTGATTTTLTSTTGGTSDSTTTVAGDTTTTIVDGETTTSVAGGSTTTTTGGGTATTTTAPATTTTTASGGTTTTTAGTSSTTTTLGEAAIVTVSDPRGFGFGYPSSWTMIQDDFGDYLITAPYSSDDDLFAESFEVYIDDFSGLDPTEYGELIAEQLAEFFDDFVLISQGPATIGGQPGYLLEYELADFDLGLRYREGYVEFDDAIVNLVYVGSGDGYDVWLADADRIWDSFDFSG